MPIPRDLYADRAITWGRFRLGTHEFYFFNTHLPHNHGEAASKSTHAKIASMLLAKRRELGAEDMPTIVVGDMNSFASDWNKVQGGGFESNLQANGSQRLHGRGQARRACRLGPHSVFWCSLDPSQLQGRRH